jgi:hypothetical protein
MEKSEFHGLLDLLFRTFIELSPRKSEAISLPETELVRMDLIFVWRSDNRQQRHHSRFETETMRNEWRSRDLATLKSAERLTYSFVSKTGLMVISALANARWNSFRMLLSLPVIVLGCRANWGHYTKR